MHPFIANDRLRGKTDWMAQKLGMRRNGDSSEERKQAATESACVDVEPGEKENAAGDPDGSVTVVEDDAAVKGGSVGEETLRCA